MKVKCIDASRTVSLEVGAIYWAWEHEHYYSLALVNHKGSSFGGYKKERFEIVPCALSESLTGGLALQNDLVYSTILKCDTRNFKALEGDSVFITLSKREDAADVYRDKSCKEWLGIMHLNSFDNVKVVSDGAEETKSVTRILPPEPKGEYEQLDLFEFI